MCEDTYFVQQHHFLPHFSWNKIFPESHGSARFAGTRPDRSSPTPTTRTQKPAIAADPTTQAGSKPIPSRSPARRPDPPVTPQSTPQPQPARPLSLLPSSYFLPLKQKKKVPISRFYFPHSILFTPPPLPTSLPPRPPPTTPPTASSLSCRRRSPRRPTPLDRGTRARPPSQLKENPGTVVPLASAGEAPRGSPKRAWVPWKVAKKFSAPAENLKQRILR